MPPFDRSTDPSLRALEALRGYASVIVVLHHFALGFLPGFKAQMSEGLPAYSLGWLMNGTGAVYVFFLLSGFVLTLAYLESGDAKALLRAAVKRLPRLWPPAAFGVLLGYLALRLHLNENVAASALSGSDWLAHFAYADQTHEVSLLRAAKESVALFLRYRTLQFNSNLWTMVVEFYGSLLALFTAFAIAGLWRPARAGAARLNLVKLVLVVIVIGLNLLIPRGFGWMFTLGAGLAYAFIHRRFLPRSVAMCLGVLGLILVGAPVDGQSMLGATLIVLCVTTPGAAPRFLHAGFSQSLGRWSFPLYITHTIGILTLGGYVYAQTAPYGAAVQLLTAFIATWAFAIAFAYPVLRWEAWYLPRLNRQIRRLIAGNS